jgi:hypothetical protein
VTRSARARPLPLLLALVAAVAISVPVLGVDPSPSADQSSPPSAEPSSSPRAAPTPSAPAAPASTAPRASEPPAPKPSKEPKPEKAAKPDKGAEVAVNLRGTVSVKTDGRWPEYWLTTGGKTYRLSAGPPWWWGANNPLAKAVGKTVTIGGGQAQGSGEVDVLTIDGTAIREAGRPPWAGGWKRVGPKHPGWAQWKVDKAHGGLGREGAPGQQTP